MASLLLKFGQEPGYILRIILAIAVHHHDPIAGNVLLYVTQPDTYRPLMAKISPQVQDFNTIQAVESRVQRRIPRFE